MESPLALEFRRPPAGPLRAPPQRWVQGPAVIWPINAISYVQRAPWLHGDNTEMMGECRPAANDSPCRENRWRSGHHEGPAIKPEENQVVALVAGENRIQKRHKQHTHTHTHTELRMYKNVSASAEPLGMGPIIQSYMHACMQCHAMRACIQTYMHACTTPKLPPGPSCPQPHSRPTLKLPPAPSPRPPGQRYNCHQWMHPSALQYP